MNIDEFNPFINDFDAFATLSMSWISTLLVVTKLVL